MQNTSKTASPGGGEDVGSGSASGDGEDNVDLRGFTGGVPVNTRELGVGDGDLTT